jgi:hypothetical protein
MANCRAGVLALCALSSGCAAGIASFAPAHVGPKGQVSATAGMEFALPTGGIVDLVDTGKALAQAAHERELGEDERVRLFAAGVNLVLNAPGFVPHLRLAYNPLDAWEVSLERAGGAWRLGGRHQLLRQEDDGADVSVGVGVARVAYGFPIDDVIGIIDVEDFRRWTFDLPANIGGHGDFYRWWAGPQLAIVHHAAKLTVHEPAREGAPAHDDVAGTTGTASLWGVHVGGAVGYRWVFVAVELGIARFSGRAELDVFGRKTSADTSSWLISPGLALLGSF